MRLATLHLPGGDTLYVNPEAVALVRPVGDNEPGNAVIQFHDSWSQVVVETPEEVASMLEGGQQP